MPKFHLVLVIHAHQPVGNFDAVFEQVYQLSYLPFVETLARHPSVRMGLHYTGPLLEWMEVRHPEFFERLRELAGRGQVELIGGGFYEPILVSIPAQDQIEQIRRLREYVSRKLGKAPTGAWLAERVWEPQLPSVLSDAEVEYTLVDDVHFLAAGFELDQLHGDYVSENSGKTVRVLPGLKALRYLLPFAAPEDAINFLRDSAARHPGGMAAMGDDCEKFGAWPNTYDHCYRDGWLERFFTALEAASDWLATSTPGEYLSTHAPLGRADLPTASYTEMMEWVLPTSARNSFQHLEREFAGRPDALRFLRGGPWRGFFSKYAESNLLNKKMLRVSEELHQLSARRIGRARRAKLGVARTHVLRAQCNDAYWHGVFGGLYAPHLRAALWDELVRAETLLAETTPRGNALRVKRCDFDADGAEEICVTSRRLSAVLKPTDGGTLAALDFRGAGITLINSLQRRPESYHSRLQEASASGAGGAVVSIHDGVRAKEEGLEKFLRYDHWPRNAFRLLLFSRQKTFEDYQMLRLDENAALAGGGYAVGEAGPSGVTLTREEPGWMNCMKKFTFAQQGLGYQIGCEIELDSLHTPSEPLHVGLELIINLLAPDEPDRYFEVGAERHPLRWGGAVPASALQNSALRVVDHWQKVAATIKAPAASQLWIAPIETVSESEQGFERVYQGSQILILWPAEFVAGAEWRGQATLDIEPPSMKTPTV